jgi:hypothetical protein
MVKAATPYAAQISAVKFPADFLAQVGKAADAVAASIATLAELRRRRVGTTKQMDELLQQGRNAVHTLDSVVSFTIMGNAGLEAEWRNAHRVTKVAGGRRAPDKAADAETPAQEVTAKAA